MLVHGRAQSGAGVEHLAVGRSRESQDEARHEDGETREALAASASFEGSEHALSADEVDVDDFPGKGLSPRGEHRGLREIDELEGSAGVLEHVALRHRYGLKALLEARGHIALDLEKQIVGAFGQRQEPPLSQSAPLLSVHAIVIVPYRGAVRYGGAQARPAPSHRTSSMMRHSADQHRSQRHHQGASTRTVSRDAAYAP